MFRPSIILVVMALISGAASAATPWDLDYAFRKTSQRDVARRRIEQIIAPTITSPALVRYSGRFHILLRYRKILNKKANPLLSRLLSWNVTLGRRGAKSQIRCKVLGVVVVGKHHVKVTAQVPHTLARDLYDLGVMGPGIDDQQPNAVRVHGSSQPERYRFAVLADHQLWDPSFKVSGRQLNAGAYPRAEKVKHNNLAITTQTMAELRLLDPEFVLYLGDLLFGVNYPTEYDEAHALLRGARLPVFAVPGNHDAYANYVVKLKGNAAGLVAGALGCRRHLSGDLSWGKAWVFISCVYGDVKQHLYADLHRDGLVFWRRQFGPAVHAFNHGRLRFVGINTYDGTPARRHAFSIYMDVLDLHLGAPAVDNYGGYLTAAQLRYIDRQAQLATKRGQTLVVFGHHDPRGNATGKRFHPNEAFPTDPISSAGFEQWNYDAKGWDSDPKDDRVAETSAAHSGHALLRILARHGGYYLSGHVHKDSRKVYAPGSSILGVKVLRRLEFISTTTAASSARDGSYWGYRVIEVNGQRLQAVDYAPEHKLASIPSGNLWVTPQDHAAAPGSERVLHSSLPRPTRASLRWSLPTTTQGYRFRIAANGGEGTDDPLALLAKAPVVEQVQLEGERATYRVTLLLPAAPFPPRPGSKPRQTRLRAFVARDNTPPQPRLEVSVGGLRMQPLEDEFEVAVGQHLVLSAARSSDPQGDRIIATYWRLGQSETARGAQVAQRFMTPGPRRIELTLVDEAGAVSTTARTINVQPPRPPSPRSPATGCGGCCASSSGAAAAAPPAAAFLILLLAGAWRRKGRR
jgi:Calcineurin-like phosphoesterase